MKKEKALAFEIYLQLKEKYSTYQFDDFVDIPQIEHCIIMFRKKEDRGELKFTIEISTNPYKIFRREIDLYLPDKEMPEIVKEFKEYEDILNDARKIAKGKSIS